MKEENILDVAILELAKMRHPSTICPSEVVRWVYPQDWEEFMPDVLQSMMRLFQEDKILVTQKGATTDKNFLPTGPVRISIK
ncbi:DUF3253 domain-containing protein [Pleomorphovibrio marinus]|uniref:DUF3253 domain-containing protein n=1 Tax=Pleomorphovibrio marinus TaxID=2164132 RepID=UPI000E0B2EC7|nr:DUF3253 domain-containing protein [Pleomorphovibrio marinus]